MILILLIFLLLITIITSVTIFICFSDKKDPKMFSDAEINHNVAIENTSTENNVSDKDIVDSTSINNHIPELTLNQAEQLIQMYLDIKNSYEGEPNSLCLFYSEPNLKADYSNYDNVDENNFVPTSNKYDDFKNAMLKYMTEELFETFDGYKNKNGFLYVIQGGRGSCSDKISEISLMANNNNNYKYSVTCLESFLDDSHNVHFTFTISYVNDHYVVSSIE